MKNLTLAVAVAILTVAPFAAHADKASPTRQETTKTAPTKPATTKPQERDIILAEEMESI